MEEEKTNPIKMALLTMHAHGLLIDTPDDIAMIAIEAVLDAAEEANELANRCDEPRCEKQATCGFPTQSGYRRTCWLHSDFAKELLK